MNNSRRKNYNQEFKIETVRLIESEGYSLGEAEMRLGVPKSTLSKWKAQYGRHNSTSSSNHNNKEISLTVFEQKQLQKELDRVKRERDILKKALAYFAADPQK